MPYALYVASVLGALALLLMMPRKGYSPRKLGMLLGVAALGGLWLYLKQNRLDVLSSLGLPEGGMAYYYIFSGLAIGSAVRVITHPKPVYSALWFVMVVLSSAGLFIALSAEFMAFAMIIIYGGAILVTYLFVIMLAAQSGDSADNTEGTEYDTVAREPVAAVAVGFLLLAVLLTVIFDAGEGRLSRIPARLDSSRSADARTVLAPRPLLTFNPAGGEMEQEGPTTPPPRDTTNIERVGLDLFSNHPLGLELAGVILIVSLVGAVVIARKQVENEPVR